AGIAAKFVRSLSVPVRSTATMLRLVLPLTALPRLATVNIASIAAFIDVIFIKVVFVVDVDVAVVPIAVTPGSAGPGTQRESRRAPRQPHPRVIPRISIGVVGICRRSINDRRVI